jgi:hypothetical protein
MTKNIDLRKKEEKIYCTKFYVCEQSTNLTWSDQVLNS